MGIDPIALPRNQAVHGIRYTAHLWFHDDHGNTPPPSL
ncbi:hypothetical protein D047_0778 [Vibrio parahaemolyticus VPTS-2010_2]|nr:hypothetical protein D047_0778 [Vibrio parahaemolyticus VPTS-2010_2]